VKLTEIKVGHWYETKVGTGKVLSTEKRFPVVVKLVIERRGVVFVAPRDILREVEVRS